MTDRGDRERNGGGDSPGNWGVNPSFSNVARESAIYSRLNHRIQPITTPCGALHAIEINAKRTAPGLVQTQDSDPLIQRRLIYSVLLNAPNARYVFEMAS